MLIHTDRPLLWLGATQQCYPCYNSLLIMGFIDSDTVSSGFEPDFHSNKVTVHDLHCEDVLRLYRPTPFTKCARLDGDGSHKRSHMGPGGAVIGQRGISPCQRRSLEIEGCMKWNGGKKRPNYPLVFLTHTQQEGHMMWSWWVTLGWAVSCFRCRCCRRSYKTWRIFTMSL